MKGKNLPRHCAGVLNTTGHRKHNKCQRFVNILPYGNLSKVNSMLDTYEQIGIDKEYSKCIKSFASVSAGGQIVSSGSNNMLEVLLGALRKVLQIPASP